MVPCTGASYLVASSFDSIHFEWIPFHSKGKVPPVSSRTTMKTSHLLGLALTWSRLMKLCLGFASLMQNKAADRKVQSMGVASDWFLKLLSAGIQELARMPQVLSPITAASADITNPLWHTISWIFPRLLHNTLPLQTKAIDQSPKDEIYLPSLP